MFLVSTTECLLNGLRSKDDLDEVRGKMTEAASSIETLIPLLQKYMAQDEPENEEAKVKKKNEKYVAPFRILSIFSSSGGWRGKGLIGI